MTTLPPDCYEMWFPWVLPSDPNFLLRGRTAAAAFHVPDRNSCTNFMSALLFNCFKKCKGLTSYELFKTFHSLCFVTISLCSEKENKCLWTNSLFLFCFFVCSKMTFYLQQEKINSSKLECTPPPHTHPQSPFIWHKQSVCFDGSQKIFLTVSTVLL